MNKSATIDDQRIAVSLSEWKEWKELCALGLCTTTTQKALKTFTEHHGRRFIFRYAHRVGLSNTHAMPSTDNMWHLFESHLTVKDNRDGKRYKTWLFDRATGPGTADTVNGGAVLLLRDVVREYLRREYMPARVVSMHSVVNEGLSGLTIEDLLPGTLDTANEVAMRELEKFAESHARSLLAEMSLREKVALLARHIGVPSTEPEVVKLAGCQKSVLSKACQGFVAGACERLKAQYPDDDEEGVRMLIVMTLEALGQQVYEWAGTEPKCTSLLALERKS